MKNFFRSVIVGDFLEAYGQLQELRRAAETRRVIKERTLRKVTSLVESDAPVNLEFGSYERRGIEGWTYVDINHNCDLVLDLTQPIPFPNGSVERVYSSHLLEHFTYKELLAFLDECRRILVKGGEFSVAVPNARLFLSHYCSPDKDNVEKMCNTKYALNGNTKIDYVNYIAYMDGYHRYMFDEDNLLSMLENAGFRDVMLRGFDGILDIKQRDEVSIYAQAFK